MRRVEQHVIEKTHPQFRAIDLAGLRIQKSLESRQLPGAAILPFSENIL
ncbi:MAG TPA: hypothetical protein VHZ51_12535 [Ktedonobacteraceae bacterium]|jgi:hypothetical protein|nr:hypothetical protein [Ktedonobacteraceae bacterium]